MWFPEYASKALASNQPSSADCITNLIKCQHTIPKQQIRQKHVSVTAAYAVWMQTCTMRRSTTNNRRSLLCETSNLLLFVTTNRSLSIATVSSWTARCCELLALERIWKTNQAGLITMIVSFHFTCNTWNNPSGTCEYLSKAGKEWCVPV